VPFSLAHGNTEKARFGPPDIVLNQISVSVLKNHSMAVRAFSRRLLTVEFARRAMLAFLVVALFLGGVQLRGWTWEKTRDVGFQYDIGNGPSTGAAYFVLGFLGLV